MQEEDSGELNYIPANQEAKIWDAVVWLMGIDLRDELDCYLHFVSSALNRVCAKNACTEVAESRMVVAAEVRVAASGEASVASETLSGVPKKIGAPSKPIWSKTDKYTHEGNALKHWKDHGKEFGEIQNSKQYVENA